MSILLVGDLHGDTNYFEQAYKEAQRQGASAIIQVGDFGLFPENQNSFREIARQYDIPFYFIDGNHDDLDRWSLYTSIAPVFRELNLYYVPRGSTLTIDDRSFLCIGGAASIDKEMRLNYGWHWTPKENISDDVVNNIFENLPVDIEAIISHAPPLSIADKNFDSIEKIKFGVGLNWFDPNMKRIEHVWRKLEQPQLYCGHMHRSLELEKCRILDINEFLLI